MAFKTITARFAGVCIRCRKAGVNDGREKIAAGQKIRFGGRGQTYHLSADCPAGKVGAEVSSRDGGEFRTCLNGGRCEDFPACGCYGLHGRELWLPQEPPDPYDYY